MKLKLMLFLLLLRWRLRSYSNNDECVCCGIDIKLWTFLFEVETLLGNHLFSLIETIFFWNTNRYIVPVQGLKEHRKNNFIFPHRKSLKALFLSIKQWGAEINFQFLCRVINMLASRNAYMLQTKYILIERNIRGKAAC